MISQMEYIKDDWKYFIILDAVRSEEFIEMNMINGDVKIVKGIASHTSVFYQQIPNMESVKLISSTPQVRSNTNKFSSHMDLWKTHWDENRGVHPMDVANVVVDEIKKDPDQRLFIHILPPHYPFVGKPYLYHENSKEFSIGSTSELNKLCKNKDPYYYECYKGNLALALTSVYYMLNYMDRDIILTTDHGTKIGGGRYGHHPTRDTNTPVVMNIPLMRINKKSKIDLNTKLKIGGTN